MLMDDGESQAAKNKEQQCVVRPAALLHHVIIVTFFFSAVRPSSLATWSFDGIQIGTCDKIDKKFMNYQAKRKEFGSSSICREV